MHEDSNNYFNITVQKVLLTFVAKVLMVCFGYTVVYFLILNYNELY